MVNHILTMVLLSPLLGVLILLFMPKDKGNWHKTVAISTSLLALGLAIWMYVGFQTGEDGMQFKETFDWIKFPLNHEGLPQVTSLFFEMKFALAVDGISMPLVFLTALVSVMAAFASVNIKKRWKTFYILFLLLEAGMFGVFMAQDLFLFFLFFEMTLVPVFFLVGIWGFLEKEKAANRFLIYNGLGSAIMFIVFLILVSTAGFSEIRTANEWHIFYSGDIQNMMNNLLVNTQAYVNVPEMTDFYLSSGMKWTLFILLLIAFGIKLPIFPFHTWMLKVHTEAPTSIVMIHSGILLKMGAYGLLRFGVMFFPEQAYSWAWVLALLGVINILYGAILAFVQNEFKLVLAYSSISHMGIVLLGIAAFNEIGLQGAMFQLVSHGLISAFLFLIVGMIYERTGTTELSRLGGLAKSMPFISGMLLVGGMASLGLPGLSGFISEFLAFLGLFETHKVYTILGIMGVILTAVYILRAVMGITFGKLPEQYTNLRDARWIEALPMIVLVAFILVIGIYPSVLSDPMKQTLSGFDAFMQAIAQKMGG
ncbi:NADH-quinone oxidoreductase subunit M [Paenibacillus sp. N1-5-1-14]|uniref:complex I subunit 4 family protein n=1 Tax=Paenibacillus radicibacter TaxID=2972488 RepID=UPI0021598A7D|nr:NADH-quinone oxidoreductase subunit M [Paenibacillus radicibacter]MCR8645079.1 NADH-quinone oxidoreductase subunit M [Paenibacillus radicibacter]